MIRERNKKWKCKKDRKRPDDSRKMKVDVKKGDKQSKYSRGGLARLT